MVNILKANASHVEGIAKVCSDGYWATYIGLRSEEYIKRVIKEFYNHERILKEVSETGVEWGGYFVQPVYCVEIQHISFKIFVKCRRFAENRSKTIAKIAKKSVISQNIW